MPRRLARHPVGSQGVAEAKAPLSNPLLTLRAGCETLERVAQSCGPMSCSFASCGVSPITPPQVARLRFRYLLYLKGTPCTLSEARVRDIAPRLGEDCAARRKFLARLQGEINERGTLDMLRNGVRHGPHELEPPPRHPIGRHRQGPAALQAKPVHGHPSAALQQGRDPARARHQALINVSPCSRSNSGTTSRGNGSRSGRATNNSV